MAASIDELNERYLAALGRAEQIHGHTLRAAIHAFAACAAEPITPFDPAAQDDLGFLEALPSDTSADTLEVDLSRHVSVLRDGEYDHTAAVRSSWTFTSVPGADEIDIQLEFHGDAQPPDPEALSIADWREAALTTPELAALLDRAPDAHESTVTPI
jgi:hypothetical protein